MSRLVVISNRLADPRKPAAGGLAVALGEALNQTGGLWFGWSGTVVEGGTPGEGELHTRQAGAVTLATVDLCREDHDSYYHGYSNSVLWPVFHYRLDLADFNASYIAGYRRVNQMFVRNEGSAEEVDEKRVRAFGATVVVQSFPIGIDVDEFTRLTHAPDAVETYENMRDEYSRRRLLLGIDRLDYSKGIPQRVRAFRELLDRYPENRDSATLIMIASPTRDDVNAYADLRQELEGLCGAVNGDYGELDWMPVRYIHRMVARRRVPGLCRAAAVGLVTPLRDGMNLVAKEYVVAQDPDDPGVLVLSRFAGAAEQLKEALLVNPYDTQGMADSIQQALQMPLVERQARHQKLMARIRQHDVHWWRKAFLDALQAAG